MSRDFAIHLVTGVLAGLALAAASPPVRAEASKVGWWIRVDTRKTEAIGIGLQLGAGRQDRHAWKSWRSNDAAEFDLPADFSQRAELYLHAAAIPDDEDVWFCVYYKGHGVRRFDFDTTEDATMKQTDRDKECR